MGHILNEHETLLQLFASFILTQNDLFEIRYELIKNVVKERPVKIECVTDVHENVKAFSKLNIKPTDTKATESSKPVEAISTQLSTDTTSSTLTNDTLATPTVEAVTSEKSPKAFAKNFLKVKFRNRLCQSSGMSYPSFNLISMKRYQPNKKIRPLKKKLPLKQTKSETEKQASKQDELNPKVDDQNDALSNECPIVEIEKSSKEKTETENLSITNKTDNKMEQSKDIISLEATSLNENVSIAKAENIIKTRSESEDDDKLFINEDDSDSINEKSQNEITINQTKEKTHDEVSFLKEPRLEATPTENETKEKIENSSHLDSASINSVELPLDLTVNKK